MKSVDRVFRIFLTVHLLAWTAVGLVRKSIAMDTAEAMIWGREWAFGTNKHPYLSGWVAELFRLGCGGDHHLAASLLAAVCTTLGMYFTYRLALRLTDRPRAVLSAMLLEGCVYFNVCGLEYNCNMLSIALMPLFFWAFHVALNGRLFHWLSVGVVAGLLLMTKYTNGVFLFTAAVYYIYLLIPHPSSFIPHPSSPIPHPSSLLLGAIVALVPFAVIVAPHIVFLVDTDFAVISYFIGRSATSSAWYDHILFPLRFFLAQVPTCWAALLLVAAALVLRRLRPTALTVRPPSRNLFVWLIATGPLLIMTAVSGVGAVQMKSMWGSTLVGAVPLLIVMVSPLPSVTFRALGSWMVCLLPVTLAAVMAVVQAVHVSARTYTDVDELADVVRGEWNRRYPGHQLAYVGGYVSFAANLGLVLPSRPQVIDEMIPDATPWLSEQDFLKAGVAIVDDRPWFFDIYRKRYASITEPSPLPGELRSYFGKTKKQTLYIGFLPPQEVSR